MRSKAGTVGAARSRRAITASKGLRGSSALSASQRWTLMVALELVALALNDALIDSANCNEEPSSSNHLSRISRRLQYVAESLRRRRSEATSAGAASTDSQSSLPGLE